MNNFRSLIRNKNWPSLIKSYSIDFLAEHMSFEELMVLSRGLLENEEWDDSIQTFAVTIQIPPFATQTN